MMTEIEEFPNPAEKASEEALTKVYACLERQESFLVEAGAGAGKTYTLVKALHNLMVRYKYILPKRHQKIACITFTNVAKNEIETRTDRSPLIYCQTIHDSVGLLSADFNDRSGREFLSSLIGPTELRKWANWESV